MSWQAAKKAVADGAKKNAKPAARKAAREAVSALDRQERAAFVVVICHDGDRGVLKGEDGAVLTPDAVDALVESAKKKLGAKKKPASDG